MAQRWILGICWLNLGNCCCCIYIYICILYWRATNSVETFINLQVQAHAGTSARRYRRTQVHAHVGTSARGYTRTYPPKMLLTHKRGVNRFPRMQQTCVCAHIQCVALYTPIAHIQVVAVNQARRRYGNKVSPAESPKIP